jgi:hypothetical protein
MRNFGEMTEEVLAHLRSFVRDQEMSTHLTADMTFSTLSIPVDNAAVVSRGRIQIDDELIWVDSADRGNSTAIIPPYGRGMDGTQRMLHLAGTRVVVQPLYPRKLVKDKMNAAITSVGRKLYGVEVITFTALTTSFNYPLPTYTRDVLSVKVSDTRTGIIGNEVAYLREWTFDQGAPTTVSASGKGLYLTKWLDPLQELTVTISRDPAALYFDVQLFTDTFLPESAWDIVVMQAAAALLATADSYSVVGRSVEANAMDAKVQAGAAVNQSKYLYQLSEQRLDEERLRLLNRTSQRAHYAR